MSQHQRNIEIKAKLANAGEFEDKINIAKKLTGEDGAVLIQHDVFFQVPNGRLKLRYEVMNLFCLSSYIELNFWS